MDKRDRTRESIITAAEALLLEKGLATTSMEEIALKAGCHRRTLYRYFPLREDLIYEAVINMMEGMNSFQRELFHSLSGTGLERFRLFLEGLSSYMTEHRNMIRFMGEFDFAFADSNPYRPDPEREERFVRTAHVTEELLGGILLIGRSDGSIRTDCPLSVFVPTVTTFLLSAAQRIALRGDLIGREFGISGMDMVKSQIGIYLEYLARREEAL